MSFENDYPSPVDKLIALGDVRGQDEWLDYAALGLALEHVPDLVRMLQDQELRFADSDSDEVWSQVHAWRALGQLREELAVAPLIETLHSVDALDDDWSMEELPVVFSMIGPASSSALGEYLINPKNGLWARITAVDSLEKIGVQYPESRDACIGPIVTALEMFRKNDDLFNAFLVSSLAELKAMDAVPLVETAFKAHCVELSMAGDFEDFQVRIGLLEERQSPQIKNYLNADAERLANKTGIKKGGRVRSVEKKEKRKRQQAKKARKRQRKKKK